MLLLVRVKQKSEYGELQVLAIVSIPIRDHKCISFKNVNMNLVYFDFNMNANYIVGI